MLAAGLELARANGRRDVLVQLEVQLLEKDVTDGVELVLLARGKLSWRLAIVGTIGV